MDLEGEKYRCTKHGGFDWIHQVIQMTEVPDLQYYKVVVSRNGGPVAVMLRESTIFIRKKDDQKRLQNVVFLFGSNGKLMQTIDLAKLIDGLD